MKPFKPKASKGVTWLVACAALTGAFEGCNLTAKVDTIGTGHPVTWCHGETIATPGTVVHVGERFTRNECDKMLAARLPQYWNGIAPCIKVETSDNEKIAYTSTAYNIGPAAFCGSAMVKALNAGHHADACKALMLYDHASGRVVQGLVNRRAAERKLCLTPDAVAVDRAAAIPKASEMPFERPPEPAPVPKPKPKLLSWSWWMEA